MVQLLLSVRLLSFKVEGILLITIYNVGGEGLVVRSKVNPRIILTF